MTSFDTIYKDLIKDIITYGKRQGDLNSVRAVYADGEKATTIALEGISFAITPSMGVPILRSKKMHPKIPLIEVEWIWQQMSNNVSWLNERGVKIWDEWALEDGTIGKSYGYQLANKKRKIPQEIANMDNTSTELNQVEFVLHELKHNPSSRRIMTTLWDVEDLDEMALEPCVWSTHWTVFDGKLNLHVKQRSADSALGLPYNVYQYHVLHAYVAKFVGIELGTMYWNIDNAHIYERHIDTLKEQLDNFTEPIEKVELVIPAKFDYNNFFNNRISDAKLQGYNPSKNYKFEIAI